MVRLDASHRFHGRAYSVWSHLIYSASRPVGPLTFRSQVFRGAKFPEALLRSGTKHFGVLTSERSGVAVRVTSLERTLVDVLHRPDLSGAWEEIWRSLESVEFFNVDQVVEYALLLGNATTSLSFLGFGLPPDVPSWGTMLSREGRQYMEMAPRLAMWPGVALTLVVYCLNMVGDALRDLLDPRLRGGGGSLGGGVGARAAERARKALQKLERSR